MRHQAASTLEYLEKPANPSEVGAVRHVIPQGDAAPLAGIPTTSGSARQHADHTDASDDFEQLTLLQGAYPACGALWKSERVS